MEKINLGVLYDVRTALSCKDKYRVGRITKDFRLHLDTFIEVHNLKEKAKNCTYIRDVYALVDVEVSMGDIIYLFYVDLNVYRPVERGNNTIDALLDLYNSLSQQAQDEILKSDSIIKELFNNEYNREKTQKAVEEMKVREAKRAVTEYDLFIARPLQYVRATAARVYLGRYFR